MKALSSTLDDALNEETVMVTNARLSSTTASPCRCSKSLRCLLSETYEHTVKLIGGRCSTGTECAFSVGCNDIEQITNTPFLDARYL